jgi:hypothetical protein
VASHFARQGDFRDFHFPTLSVLNDEFEPFPWIDDDERARFFSADKIEEEQVLYNGPPPSPVVYTPPQIPSISTLVASIIASSDRLFFVSHSLGDPSVREWRLVRVAFLDSTALYPSCLQDGRFPVEFYTLHYDDVRFDAINQRYWLQYHSIGKCATPTSSTQTHLIRPSDTSEALATKQRLIPFRRWLNLTHSNTYIHGPFEFATVNGRKTRDRVAQGDWDIFSRHQSQFQNLLPRFDLPSYSVHVDHGVRMSVCEPSHVAALCAMSSLSGDCYRLHP